MVPPNLRGDQNFVVQDDGTVIGHPIGGDQRVDAPTRNGDLLVSQPGADAPSIILMNASAPAPDHGVRHRAQTFLENPIDRLADPADMDPDQLLEGMPREELPGGDPNARAGDVQVAFDGDFLDLLDWENPIDIPGLENPLDDVPTGPPPPTPEEKDVQVIEGTVFYGGAGLEGDYIDEMVKALEEAGMFEPRAVDPEGRTYDMYLDAIRSGTTMRGRDDEPLEPFEFRQSEDPHNLIGYSYGSLEATQEALDFADVGVRVDNLVLIGSPISSEMLEEAMEHPNIGRDIVIDLTEHGDPIKAGMSWGDLVGSVGELHEQMETKDTEGKGHFYHAPTNEMGETRRRDLADQIRS